MDTFGIKAVNQKTLLQILEEVPENLRANGIRRRLKDILMIGLDTFTDMELFGQTYEEALRQF